MNKRDIILTFVGGSIGIAIANKLCKRLPWFQKMEKDSEDLEKRIDEDLSKILEKCLPDPHLDVDIHLEERNLESLDLATELGKAIGVSEDEMSKINEKLDKLSST